MTSHILLMVTSFINAVVLSTVRSRKGPACDTLVIVCKYKYNKMLKERGAKDTRGIVKPIDQK